MQSAYSSLTQTRSPLTVEDRERLRQTAKAATVAGGVLGAVALGGLAFALSHIVGGASEPGSVIVGVVFAVPLAGLLGIAVWLIRRTSADRSATEKIVYSGTITGKRTVRVEHAAQGPHQASSVETQQLVTLDGVDFKVSAHMYGEVEPGQRAELHCLREGSPFRVARV